MLSILLLLGALGGPQDCPPGGDGFYRDYGPRYDRGYQPEYPYRRVQPDPYTYGYRYIQPREDFYFYHYEYVPRYRPPGWTPRGFYDSDRCDIPW